jgi:hypothetical protein
VAWGSDELALVEREREVDIVVTRPDGSPLRVTIWAVVADGDVFIRSWRGERGHWYQAAVDRPTEVELVVAERRIPVRVEPANDAQSIARCSSALEAKYAGDPATPGMVRGEVLGTTLRVEVR